MAFRALAKIELRACLETVEEAIAAYTELDCPVSFDGAIADLLAERTRLLALDAEGDRAYRALAENLPS